MSSSTPPGSDVPYPNPNEQRLLDHIAPALQPTCDRTDTFYPDELDSVSCGGDSVPFVDYTLFGSVEELRAAYADDVQQAESKAAAGGTCAKGTYEDSYKIAGAVAGRLQCTTRTSTTGEHYRVIEWTRENLRILGYLSSATASWTQLIAYWKSDAGPTG